MQNLYNKNIKKNEAEKSFYEIALEIKKNNERQQYYESHSIDNIARKEYAMFCCWCRAFKNSDFSEKNFKEYQQKERTNFDFWLKKRIAELYFGYKFTFNYDTMKWQREKIKEGKI